MSIDETSLSNGELYTILTNKTAKGKKGAIVAMVAGTKAETVIAIIEKIPIKLRNQVTEITLDMAANMGLIAKKCFPNATQVTDRFHVQKLATEALQEIRIKYRWQAIDQENEAIEKAKKSKKKFESKVLTNGDTLKQLLARSRYFLYKNKSKWSKNQLQRALLLFELYPDIQKAYNLTQELRNIFDKTTDKIVGFERCLDGKGYSKKGRKHLLQERQQIFWFMKDYQREFIVEKMCQVFDVSKSSYYEWINRKPSKRSLETQVLKEAIKVIHAQAKFRLGSPKITVELRDRGLLVSRPRVARLMKSMGMRSIISKKFKVCTTDSNHGYTPSRNLLDRDFAALEPSQKWVSDITYVRTKQGWLYLTVVMDLFDRKIIGWAMSNTMTARATVIPALKMSLKARPINPNELIFHSDRGVQYACDEFRRMLARYHINQSMSRKANCWDNAVAESFFKILKSELIYQIAEQTMDKTKVEIFEFIEIWYNKKRKHSYLNYLTPEQFGRKTKSVAA